MRYLSLLPCRLLKIAELVGGSYLVAADQILPLLLNPLLTCDLRFLKPVLSFTARV